MSVAGLILSNLHDNELPDLTVKRTMGAVPFGGRYRLLDFPLSAMVGAELSQIYVVAHHNYRSLMEHIGSGKDWDMARHKGGIHIIPPFSSAYANPRECYDSRMQSLISIAGLIERIEEEYVLCCDCDVLGAPDFSALIKAHVQSGLSMTVGFEKNCRPDDFESLHIWIANTAYLRLLLQQAQSNGYASFYEDVVRREAAKGHVGSYTFSGRFYRIRSLAQYYQLHMLLASDGEVRAELLESARCPLLTKTQNSPPAKYGARANVSNSLIADGCVIEGCVKNSVLFRGVRVGQGCVVENAVILERCSLDGNARVSGAVLDKNVVIGGSVSLSGHPSLPFFVQEGRIIN